MKNIFRFKNINTVLLVVFFFSGFTSLIYELVWVRILAVIFGRTILATAIVVSVYMAGLGLGSIYWGRRIDRHKNYLKIFGILQFCIGISSLLILFILNKLPGFYRSAYHFFGSTSEAPMLLMFVLSFIIMFVPTFMMGGTFPVISKAFVKSSDKIGTGIGKLYAVNTMGGIIGVGLAGYYLIGNFGQIQTQIFAVFINIILGLIAFTLPLKGKNFSEEKKGVETGQYPGYILKLSLLIAGLMGFCALGYEILSFRALSIFLLNSTYSFSSVLVVFLFGISIGSYLFSRFLSSKKNLLLILAISQVVIGLYIVVIVAFLNNLPVLLFPLRHNLLKIPVFNMMLPGLFLSGLLLFIPCLCMGVSFPIVCRIYTSNVEKLGMKIGMVYFVNTMGGIIGPLIAAFVLIPFIGVSKGILIIAFVNLCIGIVLLMNGKNLKSRTAAFSLGLVIVSLLFGYRAVRNSMIHPPSIFRTKNSLDKILYYKETTAGTVLVREDKRSGQRSLYVNNNAVCGLTYDAVKVVKMLGHLPFLTEPLAKKALIIGFGAGITTAEVAKHNVSSIDCIEICPGLKEAAEYFKKFNNNIISDPRLNFISGDGRNHLLLTEKKYDFISCDPTHPTLGCGNLYTREYFRLCKDHLSENGVMSQYLPLHKLSIDEFKSLIKTFHSVFPHTTVWLGHSHGILLATPEKFNLDFRFLQGLIQILNDDILTDAFQIASSLFLDEDAIKEFCKDAEIHTDNRPFLEYFTSKSLKKENWHFNLSEMMSYRIDPAEHIYNIDAPQTMAHYMIGQEFFLSALINKNKGYRNRNDIEKTVQLFKKALEINPENAEIKLFLDSELKQCRLINKEL